VAALEIPGGRYGLRELVVLHRLSLDRPHPPETDLNCLSADARVVPDRPARYAEG
jgi:hypothetical protein